MRNLFALIMAITLLSACNKDDDNPIQTSYLPLEIGNYWIYQEFKIDSMGNETANPLIDSVIINRDTIINHKKYYILEGTYFPTVPTRKWGIIDIVRDSSAYIVNQNGIVRFAENDFTDPLAYRAAINLYDKNDTLYVISHKMEKINHVITIPAGTFSVLNYRGTVTTSMNTPGVKYPRNTNCYFAKGTGKILESYFYIAAPDIFEKRLIRYHVKK